LDGVNAVHPVTGEELPIYISDYVMMSYGTGAIMAVPAHDDRDYEFAKTFDLPIIEVISGGDISIEAYTDCEHGIVVNSGFISGLTVAEAQKRMIAWLEENGRGKSKVNYKLRDWVFSRQRYWGEPIPIVHCDKCGYVALPETELPLTLPYVESYAPTDTGESPLASLTDWVETTCPQCGGPARRETDTMPQWAGSSWYFLRYCDPTNNDALADPDILKYWMPVDWYNGGMEHTTLHLLYSRFWYKFLYDIGVVPTSEPYMKRTSHGMILGHDGEKMSKSRGNVVNPDDIVREYGADTLRLYEMFIGDFEKAAPWSETGVIGCRRFLERVWNLRDLVTDDPEFAVDADGYNAANTTLIHQTIRKVENDTEQLKFNTAVAQLMTLVNRFYEHKTVTRAEYNVLLILLNPFAPHVTEELRSTLGYAEDIAASTAWPSFDPAKCIEAEVEIAIQVNGRLRARLTVPMDSSDEEVLALIHADAEIAAILDGLTIRKEIVVKNRLVNIVATK
ncbi:MAG: leucine--tRNA ligase, partial [Clostridiaceae bacterium]|nr:leucine--tRNA ligase [Clostridiaceae bacterium]